MRIISPWSLFGALLQNAIHTLGSNELFLIWWGVNTARFKNLLMTLTQLWGVIVIGIVYALTYVRGFQAYPFATFRDGGGTWMSIFSTVVYVAWAAFFTAFVMRNDQYDMSWRRGDGNVTERITGNKSATMYAFAGMVLVLSWWMGVYLFILLPMLLVQLLPLFTGPTLQDQAHREGILIVNGILIVAAIVLIVFG